MNFVLSPHLYSAFAAERERLAESRKWLRRLREFQAQDRVKKERTVIVNKPSHLAGCHKL